MEGVGPRLSRASSRYGPSATATVFNGPVRKWKKKWVHVGRSSSSSSATHNSHSNAHTNNNNNNSRLLLCRWTPLSPAAGAGDTSSSEEPPKRKFRYTPIAVLEGRKKTAKKADHEGNAAAGTSQFRAMDTSKNEELNSDSDLKTENQDSNMSDLDLGLCLKGHNTHHGSVGESDEGQKKKADTGGTWTAS